MIFEKTAVAGGMLVRLDRKSDERGFFARAWCAREFEEQGLNPRLAQCSISFNARKGTLRGMHLQAAPHAEAKLVRCTRGALFDVMVDLRPDSETYLRWAGFELSAENGDALYIPEGCAHGFLTLADSTEIYYQMSEFFDAEVARGYRWNDPAFGIDWPADVAVMAQRDRQYADYSVQGLGRP